MTEEPFLIGDSMTGGYGGGPDILHGCTISVERGQIAAVSYTHLTLPTIYSV